MSVVVKTKYGEFGGIRPEYVTRLVFGQSTRLEGSVVRNFQGDELDTVEIQEV